MRANPWDNAILWPETRIITRANGIAILFVSHCISGKIIVLQGHDILVDYRVLLAAPVPEYEGRILFKRISENTWIDVKLYFPEYTNTGIYQDSYCPSVYPHPHSGMDRHRKDIPVAMGEIAVIT